MESSTGSEQALLVIELTRGQELLKQLQAQLDQPSGIDSCKSLASQLLSSIQKAICMAKTSDLQRACPYAGTDSGGSARSESSGQAFKDREHREMSKKRKTQPKWTNQVTVGIGEGVEGPLDDGYNWRKYGQKDILGAKHPRGYYRCTHRNTQGCQAIKQVQRSDGNPSVFDVTYRGVHTCHQRPNQLDPHAHVQQQQDLLLSFQTGLRVKTEGLGSEGQELASPSFFPSTPPVSCLNPDNRVFSSPSALENCFIGGLSPSFISPATSESNYFSVSPCQMSSYGGGANLQTAESDFTEIISAATSPTNSPMLDIDFLLDFDTSSLFS